MHLSPRMMVTLMQRHSSLVPFLIAIRRAAASRAPALRARCPRRRGCRLSAARPLKGLGRASRSNETKHRERFAVRAKHMSLMPETNRYVQHFRNIRVIQARSSLQMRDAGCGSAREASDDTPRGRRPDCGRIT